MDAFRRARNAVARRRELLRSWRGLPAQDRAVLRHLALLIPAAALAVRLLGFRRSARLVERLVPRTRRRMSGADTEFALVQGLRRAGRYAPYRGNCLSQSFVLCALLRRRGIDAHLHLGARIEHGVFSAHAWVESGGRVLNDSPDVRQQFAPFQAVHQTPVAP